MHTRSSNWNRQELTSAQAFDSAMLLYEYAIAVWQVEYAAMDVWVALRLYHQQRVSNEAAVRTVGVSGMALHEI